MAGLLPGTRPSAMAQTRVHVWMSGRVQGVYYRYAVRDQALERAITGWVRNLPDGRVEGVFEGEEIRVEGLLAFCRRGPPHARVDHLEVRKEPCTGEFRGFEIRY